MSSQLGSLSPDLQEWIDASSKNILLRPDLSAVEKSRIVEATEEVYRRACTSCLDDAQRILEDSLRGLRYWNPNTVSLLNNSAFNRDLFIPLRIALILWDDLWLPQEVQDVIIDGISLEEVQPYFWELEASIEDFDRIKQEFDSLLFHKAQWNKEYTDNYLDVIKALNDRFNREWTIKTPLSWDNNFVFEKLDVRDDGRSWKHSFIFSDEVIYDTETDEFYYLRGWIIYKGVQEVILLFPSSLMKRFS